MRISLRRFFVGSGAVALVLLVTPLSSANQPGKIEIHGTKAGSVLLEFSDDVYNDLARLALPPVPTQTQEYLNQIQLDLADNPQFGVVELSEDRTRLQLWWYGEISEELSDLLAVAPESLDQVSVVQTQLLPDDLRSAAQKIMREGAKLGVKRITVDYSGSGLQVAIDQHNLDMLSVDVDIQAELAKITDVHFKVLNDGVEPLHRLFDQEHFGGARIHGDSNECTTGFAVERNIHRGTQQGIMFAAHCGAVGDHWILYQQPTYDSSMMSYYGKTISRHPDFDGAIIRGDYIFPSHPRVWVGSYNSAISLPVNGLAIPAIGSEICYSGSFSGMVCGNIVTAKDVYTNLQADLTSVISIETTQYNGVPAVGHGDSGGPGFIYSTSLPGGERWATSIISSAPDSSLSANCTGVPGGEGQHDRKCSSVVYGTEVASILSDSGWSLQTTTSAD